MVLKGVECHAGCGFRPDFLSLSLSHPKPSNFLSLPYYDVVEVLFILFSVFHNIFMMRSSFPLNIMPT